LLYYSVQTLTTFTAVLSTPESTMASSYRHSTQDLVDGTFTLDINDNTSKPDNNTTTVNETNNNNNATQSPEDNDSDKTEDEHETQAAQADNDDRDNEHEATETDSSPPSSPRGLILIDRPHTWLDPIPEPPSFHTLSIPCPSDPFLDTLTLLAWPPLMPMGPNQRFRVVIKDGPTPAPSSAGGNSTAETERLMNVQLGDLWYAPSASPMRRLSPAEISKMEIDLDGEAPWSLEKVTFSRLKLCVLKSFCDTGILGTLWEYAIRVYGEGSEVVEVLGRYRRVRDAWSGVGGQQEGVGVALGCVVEGERLVRGSEVLRDVLGEMAVLLGVVEDEDDEGEAMDRWVEELVEDREVFGMWVLFQPE